MKKIKCKLTMCTYKTRDTGTWGQGEKGVKRTWGQQLDKIHQFATHHFTLQKLLNQCCKF